MLRWQTQQQRRRTSRASRASSSVSAASKAHADEDGGVSDDDADDDDVITRFDGESAALDDSGMLVADVPYGRADLALPQQFRVSDQSAELVVQRVAAAKAQHAELQQRRCQLESELLEQRPRRVALLLSRDMSVHMRSLMEREQPAFCGSDGVEAQPRHSAGGRSSSNGGSSSGDRWQWHLSRYLRDDPALAGLPGGVLLAEAEAENEAEANAIVRVVAAVDLLAVRLDKGEAAAAARRAAFELEADRLRAIPHHPRLCNFVQLCGSPREYVMVFDCGGECMEENATGGKLPPSISSLRQFMRAHGPRLALTLARTLFVDLLAAVAFLHERGLHHGKISAESVLVFPRRGDGSGNPGNLGASSSIVGSQAGGSRLSSTRSSSLDFAFCREVGWVDTGGGIMEDPMLLTPRPSATTRVDAPPAAAASISAVGHTDQQELTHSPTSPDDDEVACLPAADQFSCRLLCLSLSSVDQGSSDAPAGSGSAAGDLWDLGTLLHLMLAGSTVILLEPDPTLIPDGHDGEAQNTGVSIAADEPQLDPSLPEGAADLVGRLVRRNPAERQSVASLLEHRWVVEASQLPRASSQANFEEELRALNRDRKQARQAKLDRARARQSAAGDSRSLSLSLSVDLSLSLSLSLPHPYPLCARALARVRLLCIVASWSRQCGRNAAPAAAAAGTHRRRG